MERRRGDRGVSEVVGFILVFGMLVATFTVYQGIVVPDQNRQVEFQHNQDVQGQLQELRNAVLATTATGSGQAVSITLGATYPQRTIAMNLGVSGGAISTHSTGSPGIRIDNVEASNGETRDYVNSAANGPLGPFETKSIQYTPVYSFYSGAPETVYENSIAYNQFDNTNLTLTDQTLVDGRRITLVAVNGSLSKAQRDTVSVSTEAISTSSNRIAVKNTSGQQVTITLPTRLSASQWAEILEEEMGPGGYVDQVDPVPGEDAVELVMRQDETYELRMAKVGVGDLTSDEDPKYVTDIEGDDVSVPEDGTQKLVVEVRDRFNNPVSNVGVDATITQSAGGDEALSPSSDTTDSDGRATFIYSAPSDVSTAQDVDVDVSFDGDGTANETVAFDLRVLDSDGSGGGGGGGPSNYAIDWTMSSIETQQGVESCSGNRCTYNLSKDSNTNLDLATHTTPALAGVFVDFSTNDSSIVDSLTPEEDTTDSSGETTVTADVDATGTVAIYASAAEDSDVLILDVTERAGGGGGGGPTPGIATRIDDLSLVNENRPLYVTSYSISDTNGSFQYVSVEYANQDDPSASEFVNGTGPDARGNLQYSKTWGAGDTYEITIRVIYEDGSGDEYVAASETITDAADGGNPSGNDDLSVGGSPAIQSLTVTDRSNGGQGPRYDFDYTVSPIGSFGQVDAYVVGLSGGGRGSQTSTSSSTVLTVSAGYGYNQQVKLSLLVFDDDGVVVDAYVATDTADGTGP